MTKTEIQREVDKAIDFFNDKFQQVFEAPDVTFTGRGRMGGTCYHVVRRLNFNIKIAKLNPTEYINVIWHEVAHLIAYEIYSTVGHDRNWRYLMGCAGKDDSRCHNMKTGVTLYKYQCPSCNKTWELTLIRHNKMVKGKARYICNCGCNKTLKNMNETVED